MVLYNLLAFIILTSTSDDIHNLFNVYMPPEQIPPIYYTDEVLPICITGPQNTPFNLQVLIENPEGEIIYGFTPENPTIQSNSVYCFSITDFPPIRGFFTAEVRISYKDFSGVWKISFCRLERFTPKNKSIFGVIEPPQNLLPFLKLYWFDEVVFSAESPQIQEIVQNAINRGYEVSIEFDPNKFSSSEDSFEHLYSQVGPYVNKWDFKSTKNNSFLTRACELITKTSKTTKISFSIDSIESLSNIEPLISDTEQIEINWCGKLDTTEIEILTERLIETRAEIPKLSISLTKSNLQLSTSEQFQKVWELLTLDISKIKLSSELLFQDGHPTPLVPFIFAISRLWEPEIEFIGWYQNEPTLKACVFSSPQGWLLTFWGEQPLTLTGETLATTQGFDIYSNPISLPSLTNGSLTVDARLSPSYLTGNCYNVVVATAQNNIKILADKMINSQLATMLPQSIIESIKAISQNPRDTQNRVRLIGIFRYLPEFEKNIITDVNWRSKGALLTYYLYDFLRKSCILEQSKTEPFREPFLDIKTRCEEYITSYLTGSSISLENDRRANVLMKEVNRILELADKTSSNGKRIEASALLYLAEGMALSLIEHLKVTPLMLAEDKISKQGKPDESKPGPSSPTSQALTPPTSQRSSSEEEDISTYTVVAGDTLSKIANKLGTTTKELLLANNLTEKSILRIGQKLRIPGKQKETPFTTQPSTTETPQISKQPEPKEETTLTKPPEEITPKSSDEGTTEVGEVIVYKIQPGDIPATIAQKFGITAEALMKFNNITDPTKLRVGQELKIPNPKAKIESTSKATSKGPKEKEESLESSPPEQPEPENIIHTVEKGDSPYTIGKKYGVPTEEILRANNLTPKSILQIGQKLIIPKPKKKQ